MRFSVATFVALGAASSALAQSTSPIQLAQSLLGSLSPTCSGTVLQLVSQGSPLYQCAQIDSLIPVILSTGSIIEPLDAYVTDVCASAPCTNTTLNSVAQSVITACSSDLAKFGISNETLSTIFGLYPLAREITCLKTSAPFNGTNATIPISSAGYNSTNGTFCVTSLLTELSAYLGTNLTNSLVDAAILSGNRSTLQMIQMIPPTALCSDCVFAAVDLIYQEYPEVGSLPVSANLTVNTALNGQCNATRFQLTSNGTLPTTISEVAVNSTYPFNVTTTNATYTPGPDAVPPPRLNQTAVSAISSIAATATASGAVVTVKRAFNQL